MSNKEIGFQPPAGDTLRSKRGYLPHMERAAATYFVTFRTADSLPATVIEQWHARKLRLQCQKAKRELLPVESVALEDLSNRQIEGFLDKAHGSCPMRQPSVARVIADALKFWDDERYILFAWVVMPNHVHVVLTIKSPESLASIVTSWKSYTANRANNVLGRTGPFWQREYFDRILRDQSEFERAVDYVSQNPAQGGLSNWPWVWRRSDA